MAVLRGPEKNGDPFLDTPFKISVILCAVVTRPRLTARRQYLAPRDRERVKSKVEAIVRAAVLAKYPVVVLSAFGCGTFGTPPEVVAELFRDALASVALSEVVFCIVDDHNSNQERNPSGNVAPFQE
eukprot:4388226-Alexandrium_andersonii.AAC.1